MISSQRMWKRLEKLGQVLQHRRIQYPLMFQEVGETREDLEIKLERWKTGEEVEGICGKYEGGEVGIGRPFSFDFPGDV